MILSIEEALKKVEPGSAMESILCAYRDMIKVGILAESHPYVQSCISSALDLENIICICTCGKEE